MAERQQRRELGQSAEQAAVDHLVAHGYQIEARNFACKYGELDIVAQRDGILCFVEVRMRSRAVWGDPSQTITFSKQRRVVKAALHYLVAHRITGRALRFDVIAMIGQGPGAAVEHLENAFDAGM
ncbi:MAG: YraN family protein [Myxococcota bacterium]|nr:YraN family protein [Myxococcota bacterium]